METFKKFEINHEILSDMSHDFHPTQLRGMVNGSWDLDDNSTHIGFVLNGKSKIKDKVSNYELTLNEGMYFQIPNRCNIDIDGQGIIISRLGFKGIFKIGGPIEKTGRLNYIDGCTDTLLIDPVMMGDPCLNALYFIPNIFQTQHTHPSIRVGVVVQGKGECIVPRSGIVKEEDSYFLQNLNPEDRASTKKFNELFDKIELNVGTVFVIPTDCWHSFRTFEDNKGNKTSMTVIAYHPDSDFGPQHEDHPMINRTMVDGVSANKIDKIRTKRLK